MQHAWNTHYHYTKHGQRIAAELREDGSVVFADIDRGIYGIIVEPSLFPILKESDLRDHVMYFYTHRHYRGAWEGLGIDRLIPLARNV